jgi:crotonobetainyl-CoA:carnitine CoA-transferase CaiB-like acyl-CoA transferase
MLSALNGIRVLDLSASQMPGRWTSGMLSDFGAQVILIERIPYGGNETGPSGFQKMKSEKDLKKFYAYNSFDRNKKSMGLNLKAQESKEIFYKLVTGADVVIEGYRPGVAKKLGIDYETLQGVNPRIVYCSITSYGQDGPYEDYPGHDLNYMALAGALDITGEEDRDPVMPGVQIGDWVGGGFMAVVGILLGLMARDVTKRGQHVDISMTDGVLACMAMFVEEYFRTGKIPRRGNRINTGGSHYNNIYKTKDNKYITIAAWEPQAYKNLCQLLNCEELIEDQHPKSAEKKKRAFETFRNTFLARTRQEWFDYLKENNVSVAPLYSLDEVFADLQIKHRKMMIENLHPTEGMVKQIGVPIKLSDTPGRFERFSPLPCEHTVEILSELGYSNQEIEKFKAKGSVG